MKDIYEAVSAKFENINTKSDLADFLRLLADDFENDPDEWENCDIPQFLKAIAAYAEDSDDISHNDSAYKTAAQLFYLGKIYE